MPSLNQQEWIDHIDAVVANQVNVLGLDLVELKVGFHRQDIMIQILADRPRGGISLDECAALNEGIAKELDEKAILPSEQFSVEVASPGLDRPLKSYRDFLRNLDYNIRISLRESVEGKKEWVGQLVDANEKELCVRLAQNKEIHIPVALVQWGYVIV